MSTPSTDSADPSFWKAYGGAIMDKIGGIQVNDTTAFYLGSEAQRGPPGGDNIDASYTNEGLFQVGNNLLPPDQLFYSPSTMNSYLDQLKTYLAWVDVGGDPSGPNIQQVTNTRQDMEAADLGQRKALKGALEEYQEMRQAGLTGDQSFPQWAPGNAPQYTLAVQIYKSKSAAYQRAFKIAYGPLADQKILDEAKLDKAADSIIANPGFNMNCVLGSPPSPREIENGEISGNPLPVPPPFLRPAYESQSYVSFIKDAQALVGRPQPPKATIEISYAQGKEIKETKFNSSASSGGYGFGWWPWISFWSGYSNSSQSSSVSTEKDASSISIKMFYDDLALVPINPSASWDLGDVRTKYKGLLPGAPQEVKTLVKPTELVLVTRLGYTVKLHDESAKQFDSMYQSHSSSGGYVCIFGIPCSLGGSTSSSTEETTHSLEWNSTDKTFTVRPTDNAGFATILGLIGEKIKTTA